MLSPETMLTDNPENTCVTTKGPVFNVTVKAGVPVVVFFLNSNVPVTETEFPEYVTVFIVPS